MTTIPAILRHARRDLALLSLLVGAGVAAVLVTSGLLKNARLDNATAHAHLRASEERLAHINDERQNRLRQIETWRGMVARGRVGEERQTQWIERIRAAVERRRLSDVRPVFSGVRMIAGKSGAETVVRGMTLRMPLLHENDLIDLLDDLRQSVPAHLRLRRCVVTWRETDGASVSAPSLAQLDAECAIEWITWRIRKADAS